MIKEDKTISYKAVCIDGQNQASRIWYEGSENSFTFNTPDVFKNASVIKTMTYSSDNILLFSAFSGKNNTIMTDSPTATKVYSVEFQKCEDQEKYNYPVVKIGEQWWMAKNLQSTKFNDGTPIEYIADNTPWMWAAHEAGAYCWFENSESSNKIVYGGLYNWYAVNRGKLCPAGWHVPNDEEWKQLELMLGMTKAQADATGWRGTDQGTRLKAPYGWKNDGNGSNISGFSGLSSGWRDWDGSFDGNGKYSGFWSVTPYSVTHAWSRTLGYQTGINRTWDYMEDGLSIRCCRDN